MPLIAVVGRPYLRRTISIRPSPSMLLLYATYSEVCGSSAFFLAHRSISSSHHPPAPSFATWSADVWKRKQVAHAVQETVAHTKRLCCISIRDAAATGVTDPKTGVQLVQPNHVHFRVTDLGE